jgi:REP element-mobilizing transposase RayT
MPTGYQIIDQSAPHYLTIQVVFWIDLFTRQIYRDLIIESIRYCQKEKGLEIYAWVIMSNHIHLLARSNTNDLSGTLRDLKKHTSKEIVNTIMSVTESRKEWMLRLFKHAAGRQNKTGMYQVWTHENHAVEVYGNKFIQSKVEYIHHNPVRAGIVESPEQYIYSSAGSYADQKGLLDIIPVVRIWKTVR